MGQEERRVAMVAASAVDQAAALASEQFASTVLLQPLRILAQEQEPEPEPEQEQEQEQDQDNSEQ